MKKRKIHPILKFIIIGVLLITGAFLIYNSAFHPLITKQSITHVYNSITDQAIQSKATIFFNGLVGVLDKLSGYISTFAALLVALHEVNVRRKSKKG